MASISFPTSIGGVNIPGLSSNPLGALFSDPFELDILKYPRDLGASTRTHYIVFDIYDITPTTLDFEQSVTLDSIKDAVTDIVGNIQVNEQSSAMQGFSEQRLDLKKTIALYIPDTVNFNYDANYGEINLGGQDSALTKIPGAIGTGLKAIASTVTSDAARLFLRTQGIALNPNQQVMFDGLNLRTFAFEFNFMPKSKDESKDVRDIIQAFKLYSRPSVVKNTFGMIYNPPSVFRIQFRFLNKENRWVNKIADSALTSVEVDYAQNGWATHQDGSPVNVKMKLEFKELSLIDRDGVTGVSRGY